MPQVLIQTYALLSQACTLSSSVDTFETYCDAYDFFRYLVLANMLMESEVNPFDGQEAKP